MEIEIYQLPEDLILSLNLLKKIILDTCHDILLSASSISFIFVSDEELAEIHGAFLHDNSITDVITFNLGENDIEGEIYISSDRAKDQAKQYKVSYEEEVIRLMIHGILHLADYNDIKEADRKKMKEEEERLVLKSRSSLKFMQY